MRRALLAGALIALVAAAPARAQTDAPDAVVIILDGASLPDLMAVDELHALATNGGVALMNGRGDVRDSFSETFFPPRAVGRYPFTYIDLGSAGPDEAARTVTDALSGAEAPVLAFVISASPPAASAADGDELGTVIMAKGDPATLLDATGEPKALTSDSTRRPGVVADVDPAATVADWLDLPYDEGSPIETTDEPAPLDLYERYLQQRRLAVPIAVAAWGFVLVAGIVGIVALRFRRSLSDRWLAVAGWFPATLPWLALGLLLVGHLPTLTYATVLPTLVVFVAAGVVFTRWVASRRGIFVAIAACGAVVLVVLALEAALGWPAAVTPYGGRRTARRRAVLRDAQHRDRDRARRRAVRRAPRPGADRRPPPGRCARWWPVRPGPDRTPAPR